MTEQQDPDGSTHDDATGEGAAEDAAKADPEAKLDPAAKSGGEAQADEPTGDIVFDTLWARVLEAWDDDKPHGALVQYALKSQKLPELAGKYKSMTHDPEKKARAQKRLDGVVMAATQLLFAMKSPPLPKSNKTLNVIAVLMAISAMAFLAYRLIASKRGLP